MRAEVKLKRKKTQFKIPLNVVTLLIIKRWGQSNVYLIFFSQL